ncbi:MAG TPA: acetylxylan esterase [Phycisphaerae bacterium]|nr:acetylxylan esterase [Phycisphaerae bacterium]
MTAKKWCAALAMVATCAVAFGQATVSGADGTPVKMTAEEDLKRMCALLGVEPLLKRPAYNYDEAKANPFPELPDPLMLKNGEKVTDGATWWGKRRPEIVEDFEREVYGRMPKETPKVTWEVASRTEGKNGEYPIVTKMLVGHVDNASYPAVKVDIQVMLVTPADAKGPVPVMMQFSGFGFGFPGGPGRGGPRGGARGGATQARGGAGTQAGTRPAVARGRGGPAAGGPGIPAGPSWQQQLLAKGWGYALLNTGSVQADNGAGLTSGIIGLCNKGQPRKLDDWGVLEAWAWGASRALDYFETDPAVDAKRVGLEGHSRWGKATIVAMAFDQRFAIAYVSSSGEGGARLHRRNYGEPLDAVCIPEEYHWMAGNFLKYVGHWDKLPVDSHELIALCAPRPVMITGGTFADRGVDTKGMFMAAVAAGPVYRLLGKKDLGVTEMPAPNTALIDGDIAFRQHDGGHSDAYDWPTFVEFASRYWAGGAK